MIHLEAPKAVGTQVQTIVQYGILYPDGTVEFENIDSKGSGSFKAKWNDTYYYLDTKHDANTKGFPALASSYIRYMRGNGVEAEILRVKREIIVILQPEDLAP